MRLMTGHSEAMIYVRGNYFVNQDQLILDLRYTFSITCIFRAEEKLQSSREVKGRQEVDKQTPQNRPIYQQSRGVLVSSRAEIKSGPNMKIPNGLISHLSINSFDVYMFR